MENKLNFKAPNGAGVELSFDPNGDLLINLESDTTPLSVEVQSPTKKTKVEFIGGRDRRG